MRVYRDLHDLPTFKNPVITIGTFDGVHIGHQRIIERLKQLSLRHEGENILITFHPHPRFVINPNDQSLQLITTLEEKLDVLKLYGVDNVVVAPFSNAFSKISAKAYIEHFLVEKFNPKVIVIGYDHHFGNNREGNIELLREYAHTHQYLVEEISKKTIDDIAISSTKIRTALHKGAVDQAHSFLGHRYFLTGTVVQGDQVGRTIHFPTANIALSSSHKLIPANGVYAVRVKWNDNDYVGMLNIGHRPTFGVSDKTIEVHILNFSENIYGEPLRVEFVQRIRDEQKFKDVQSLEHQLQLDRKKVTQIFSL